MNIIGEFWPIYIIDLLRCFLADHHSPHKNIRYGFGTQVEMLKTMEQLVKIDALGLEK